MAKACVLVKEPEKKKRTKRVAPVANEQTALAAVLMLLKSYGVTSVGAVRNDKTEVLYRWAPPTGSLGTDINMQVRELHRRGGCYYVTMPGRVATAKVPGDYEWNVGRESVEALTCYATDIANRIDALLKSTTVAVQS